MNFVRAAGTSLTLLRFPTADISLTRAAGATSVRQFIVLLRWTRRSVNQNFTCGSVERRRRSTCGSNTFVFRPDKTLRG